MGAKNKPIKGKRYTTSGLFAHVTSPITEFLAIGKTTRTIMAMAIKHTDK